MSRGALEVGCCANTATVSHCSQTAVWLWVDAVFELYQRSIRVCSDNLRNNIMRLKIEQFIYESVEQEMMNNYLADQ